MKMSQDDVLAAVDAILAGNSRVELDMSDPKVAPIIDDLNKVRVRLELSRRNIVVDFPKPGGKTLTLGRMGVTGTPAVPEKVYPVKSEAKDEDDEPVAAQPQPRPVPQRHQHKYHVPKISKDIMDVLLDKASAIIQFAGPTGCGKTVLAHYVAEQLGFKLFKYCCLPDMPAEDLFGSQTVEIDEKTGQNHVVWVPGLIEKWLTCGLDESGNETGQPGMLFIDEAPAMPARVAIGLNSVFESDSPKRTFRRGDGKVITGHSGARIILAGNTKGRGATNAMDALHTAQLDALDLSLLNRVAEVFNFGYDRKVEMAILMEKVGDDGAVRKIIQFRDAIRDNLKSGMLTTPLSTRTLVFLADAFRRHKNIGKALWYAVIQKVMPEEVPTYNETVRSIWGVDLVKEFADADMDYA